MYLHIFSLGGEHAHDPYRLPGASEGEGGRGLGRREEGSGEAGGEGAWASRGMPSATPSPLQGEPPVALGLSTRKALSILKEQLEAVLDGHLKERKKCLTWKVTRPPGSPEPSWCPGLCAGGKGICRREAE